MCVCRRNVFILFFFLPSLGSVLVAITTSSIMSERVMSKPLDQVKNVVLVVSGKGGVGKSSVACQLAFTYAYQKGLRVGLLDVDLCGPSVPTICGVEKEEVFKSPQGWVPVTHPKPPSASPSAGNLQIMSMGFLLPSEKDAVAWRGPKKCAMIETLIEGGDWGPLDLLLIDTPPGTSDEHFTVSSLLKPFHPLSAIVVTTPQQVSCDDVRKELSLCHKLDIRALGIVENMSGFTCPHCRECTKIFSSGGGSALAERYDVPFLGAIPIDPSLSLAEDSGVPLGLLDPDSDQPSVVAFRAVADALDTQLLRMRSALEASEPP